MTRPNNLPNILLAVEANDTHAAPFDIAMILIGVEYEPLVGCT